MEDKHRPYYGLTEEEIKRAKSRFASSAASLDVSEEQRDEIAATFKKTYDELTKKEKKNKKKS